MNFKTFIIGLLVLILTPILVIGGFAAYTHLSNASSQSGLLHYSVEPQIVFTGEPTTYTVRFNGHKAPRPEGKPPPPVDMIFVVDVSGSMHESLPDMVNAAHAVANELVKTNPSQHISFALTQFHDSSEIKSGWTSDSNRLYAGLNNLEKRSGNSGTALAFPPIHQLLSQARTHAIKAVVFYTDGHIGVDDAIIEKAEALRNQGVQIFSISPPGYDAEAMLLITGDPSRVLEPMNLRDIVIKFRHVTDVIMGLYGYNAQLSHPLDRYNFSTPVEDSEWHIDNSGNLQRNIGYLPFKSVTYLHPLVPQTLGLWKIGLSAPEMTFFTSQNQLKTMIGERQPRLLVLSIWLLLFAFLPALLWLLAYFMRHKPAETVPNYIPPPIRSIPQPSPLPLPSAVILESAIVPTLFIGLGGAGHQALYAVQEQLKAANLEANNPPYRFLWLDLDSTEIPFVRSTELPVRNIVAPLEIRQSAQYLPSLNQSSNHLEWFNSAAYIDASREKLDLSRGAKGERILARLALFQWLKKGELLTVLKEESQKLLNFDSVDGSRQIVLFADRTGGTGSGWMVDIARLLRRLARKEQQHAQAFVPEIICILSSASHYPQQQPQRQKNRQALDKEIETAQMTGAFPQRVTYLPHDALLDQVDSEGPINWLFSVSGQDSDQAVSQSAALSAVLVERYPRWTLLNHNRNKGQCLTVQAKGIHVMPDLNYQLVKREVLLRLLGPTILLDLELDAASQKLVVKPISDSDAERLLIQWNSNEPKSTPWQLLLNSVIGLEGSAQFFEGMAKKANQEKSHPDLVWFQQAFVASLTRQLRGHRKSGRWVRAWMPGQAVAALRLFAERLTQRVKPQTSEELADILTQVIDLIKSSVTQLEKWLTDFVPLCEDIGKHQLAQQRETAKNRVGQVFIDKSVDKQHIEQWAEEAMQKWVGSKDMISALCERLFFTARLDKNNVVIVLAIYVEERQEFSSEQVETAVKRLESYADTAAQQVPTLKVEGALAELEAPALREHARNMIDTQHRAEQVVMVMPTVEESEPVSSVLNAFKELVVNPAKHEPADSCYGNDHSAIRRLELRTEVLPDISDTLPFVQTAEQIAELTRQKAIDKFNMDVPIFPPALRIALSQTEAFRSFSRAYKSGHIVKPDDEFARDERGISQWVFGDKKAFLTFGEANSLADAAANYVYMMKNPPMIFTEYETPGDFSGLETWQETGGAPPDDDVFVLIAMMLEE